MKSKKTTFNIGNVLLGILSLQFILQLSTLVVAMLLLLAGDVERNPGPVTELTMDDHQEVCDFLENMDPNQLRDLGGILGLHYANVTRMNHLPAEMVAAWLRAEDNVLPKSGPPSWESLVKSLKKARQNGIAEKVEKMKLETSTDCSTRKRPRSSSLHDSKEATDKKNLEDRPLNFGEPQSDGGNQVPPQIVPQQTSGQMGKQPGATAAGAQQQNPVTASTTPSTVTVESQQPISVPPENSDTTYTQIVQEIYHGVTSDKIILTAHSNTPLSRSDLCEILVTRHNTGKNPGQKKTNQEFLSTAMTLKKCLKALTYTTGYNSASGWEKWSGCHKGTWYGTRQQFIDSAVWFEPALKEDEKHTYAVQSVRFDSEDRIKNHKTKDMTGATCRYGWNQSAKGVQYVWGWDPKNIDCPKGNAGGRSGGTHVGFTFSCGKACCIIWVSNQEAFLECTQDGRRTSTASGPKGYEGYGQWTIS